MILTEIRKLSFDDHSAFIYIFTWGLSEKGTINLTGIFCVPKAYIALMKFNKKINKLSKRNIDKIYNLKQ